MLIGDSSGAVRASLDGLMLRQQAIAQNIANLNTPGYRPVRVDFESVIQEAADGLPVDGQPRVYTASEPTSANYEVGLLSETVLRYQTLLKMVNKQISIMQLAISEGKR